MRKENDCRIPLKELLGQIAVVFLGFAVIVALCSFASGETNLTEFLKIASIALTGIGIASRE